MLRCDCCRHFVAKCLDCTSFSWGSRHWLNAATASRLKNMQLQNLRIGSGFTKESLVQLLRIRVVWMRMLI